MVQWPEGFIKRSIYTRIFLISFGCSMVINTNDNYFHLFHQKLFGISMKVLY